MTRSPPDGASFALSRRRRTSVRFCVRGAAWRTWNCGLFWCAAAVALAAPAGAQTWRVAPTITLQETATNNVNLAPTDSRTSDLVTQLTPTLALSGHGDHTSLDGSLSIPILLYARTSENNYVAPAVHLLGDVNFLDRILHVEGSVDISEQFFTPFGAQPPDLANATDNRYRTTTYRVSPYVMGVAGNGIAYELRNNNVWNNLSGAPSDTSNSRYTEWFARASSPENRQFGLAATYDYTDITFPGPSTGSLQSQIGRLIFTYNVDPALRLGADVGYEQNQGALTSSQNTVYGVGLNWRPTERTKVVGRWEHRYFGSSYLFNFDHRTALTVWNVNASRNVTTYPQQLGALGAGSNVPAYLNQLFLSSIPDQTARQQAVDQFIRDRGLPQTLETPVTLYADQIILQQQVSATVGLVGVRNSIFFSVFNVRSEPISAAGTPLPPALNLGNDNTQTGGNIVWSNRLTQGANLVASLNASRTVANGPSPANTKQASAQMTLSRSFSARTSGFIGARYQALTSDVSSDYNEAAVFVGVGYALR